MIALLLVFLASAAHPAESHVTDSERLDILKRAQVWTPPAVPIAQANLAANPTGDDGFAEDQTVECRFEPHSVGGSTPKFDCRLPSGGVVKVKYGAANAEVYTEVAATRLLAALGFPTDRMYRVAAVRCFGCPPNPFAALKCLYTKTVPQCFAHLDYGHARVFTTAAIERPLEGRRIETKKVKGWGWHELASIDSDAGGASRAEVDALRLMAVFLADWDNKPRNQRLLCLGAKDDAGCEYPVAMAQDLGGTFGPFKLNLERWRRVPIWTDRAACLVSMASLPYGGSSFHDVRISEDGRRFLAECLRQFTPQQVHDLFAGAGIASYPKNSTAARDVDTWVRAFAEKVKAIDTRPPCPE
jgi:hypothetical protein